MAITLLTLDYKAWQQKGQKLAMASAIVYAAATKETCPLVNSGPRFKGLENVIYLEA